MTRYLNAHNLKYIWFGPIPLLNLERLRTTRRDNPQAHLSLTISRDILTPLQFADLYHFCHKQHIQLITLETLEQKIQTSPYENDKKLIEWVKQELQHPNGNPAGASDILRAMTSFWIESDGSGVYLDLDTKANTSETKWLRLDNTMPYLLPLYVITQIQEATANNDVIVMTIPKKKMRLSEQAAAIDSALQSVQTTILERYKTPFQILLSMNKLMSNPITQHTFKNFLDRLIATIDVTDVFSIRPFMKISFDDWHKAQCEAFKQYYLSDLLEQIKPEQLSLKRSLLHLTTIPYEQFTDGPPYGKTTQKIYQATLGATKNYLGSLHDSAKKKFGYFGIDIKTMSDEDACKIHHVIEAEFLYTNFLMKMAGTTAWFDLLSIPEPLLPEFSLYHYNLGTQYIGQGGASSTYFRSPQEEEANDDTLPDNSWVASGQQAVKIQSESIARQKLATLFLPKVLPKIRAALLAKKAPPIIVREAIATASTDAPTETVAHLSLDGPDV